MKVYGQLERAQAELLAADPTGTGLINGRFYYNNVTNKLSFYDGAVRQVVSEDGTQTLTNKTLTGNIAGNFSPDGVETLTLPAVTDTIAVLAAAQTLENKSLPTINFPHQATPTTPAAGNSKLYVKSDRKAYLLDEEGNEIPIGTGGGGLDIFHTEDFSVNNAADMTTGNNATFLGGGSIVGTVADFTDSEGNRQLRYTQAAGSLNDYFAAPVFSVPLKARNGKSGAKFVYTYTGDAGDIKPEIYDVTNGASLVSETVLLESNTSYKTFEIYVDIPTSCTQLRFGYHVKVENIGAILTVDDFQINADALAPSEVFASSHWTGFTPTLSNFNNLSEVDFKYRRVGDSLEVTGSFLSSANAALVGTISLPDGLQIDFDKLPTPSSAQAQQVGEYASSITTNTNGGFILADDSTSSNSVGFGHPVFGGDNTGNTLIFQGANVLPIDSGICSVKFTVPIQGWSNVERGVSVRGSVSNDIANVNEFSFDLTTALGETNDPLGIVQGVTQVSNTASERIFDVFFKSGVFSAAPKVVGNTTGPNSALAAIAIINQSTTGFRAIVPNSAGTNQSTTFFVSRGTGDYVRDSQRTVVLPNGLQNPVAYVKDVKPSGTNGGSSVSGTITRDLNTLEGDTSFLTLSSNQITLQPGSYDFEIRSPFFRSNNGLVFLQNITDGTSDLIGSPSYGDSTVSVQVESVAIGRITITQPKVYEVRLTTNQGFGTSGLGVSRNTGFGEVYTQVKITKRS